jgi:hypothetical protein
MSIFATMFATACGQGLSTPRASSPMKDGGTNSSVDQRDDRGGSVTSETSPDQGPVLVPDADEPRDTNPPPTDVNQLPMEMPLAQTKPFPPATGGDFDFGAGRFSITSNTFEGSIVLSHTIATTPPRAGPLGATHKLSVSPTMKTRVPARIQLRIPTDWQGNLSTWQLAYFEAKPADPPGLWLACAEAAPAADERALEGKSPPFDEGFEHFALLRRCSDSKDCVSPFTCLSGLCQ